MGIRIPRSTLQIQTKGAGRLSPDLSEIAEDFVPIPDRENKKLILDGRKSVEGERLRAYSSQKHHSRSKMISLVSALKDIGLDAYALRNNIYEVKVDGKKLEIQF